MRSKLLIAFFRNCSFPFRIFTSEANILFAKFCSFLVDLASHLFQEPLSDGRGSSESGWRQAFSLPMSLPHLTQCGAENTRLTLCCLQSFCVSFLLLDFFFEKCIFFFKCGKPIKMLVNTRNGIKICNILN